MHPAKVNTINTIQLIADLEAQSKYEATAAIAHVPDELVNQWFDDFHHPDADSIDHFTTITNAFTQGCYIQGQYRIRAVLDFLSYVSHDCVISVRIKNKKVSH